MCNKQGGCIGTEEDTAEAEEEEHRTWWCEVLVVLVGENIV